jgi:hypothetical protein
MSWLSRWKSCEPGPSWFPFVFLSYLVFCFIEPVQSHASWEKWVATIAGVLFFLTLYFTAYLRTGPISRWAIAGM